MATQQLGSILSMRLQHARMLIFPYYTRGCCTLASSLLTLLLLLPTLLCCRALEKTVTEFKISP